MVVPTMAITRNTRLLVMPRQHHRNDGVVGNSRQMRMYLEGKDNDRKARLHEVRYSSKLAVESSLHAFDLPFTIIRPNYFNQNDVGLKDPVTKAGIYPMPLGPVGVSTVDVRDIAEATAIALTNAGHEGKTYNLNGPDIVSGLGAAAIWS
jgi:uncharacterized protein YbjT (DUF2867 family)